MQNYFRKKYEWDNGLNNIVNQYNNCQLTFTGSNRKIETLEKGKKYFKRWRRSSVFIVNFEHISHLFLVFLLWTLNK